MPPRKIILKREMNETPSHIHETLTKESTHELIKVTEASTHESTEESYALVLKFLSSGQFPSAYHHFVRELTEQNLLPRRYHAFYSREGKQSGIEKDDGQSLPLTPSELIARHPQLELHKLVKLLKQPTSAVPSCKAHQVDAINIREIDGGFHRHHRQLSRSGTVASFALSQPHAIIRNLHLKRVKGHTEVVLFATVDRTGRYAITASDDRLVKVWCLENALCLASCRGTEGDFTGLSVNADNTIFASCSTDTTIRVWTLPHGRPISILRGHALAVSGIAFSPRPHYHYLLSSSSDGTCRLWDARDSQIQPKIYVTPEIKCFSFNSSGTFFATGSSGGLAQIWVANESLIEELREVPWTLRGHTRRSKVDAVCFSGCAMSSKMIGPTIERHDAPINEKLITTSDDGQAMVWVRSWKGITEEWVKAYNLRVPLLLGQSSEISIDEGVHTVSWSVNDEFIVASTMKGKICIFKAADGSLIHKLPGHYGQEVFVVEPHPICSKTFMTAGYDGRVVVWDIRKGVEIREFVISDVQLLAGKFSVDGTSIVVSDADGNVAMLTSGGGDSLREAMDEQFFLGDFRALETDGSGNVYDEETGLEPHDRNMRDWLCKRGAIPYDEDYQIKFHRRRLAALGCEWIPQLEDPFVGVTPSETETSEEW